MKFKYILNPLELREKYVLQGMSLEEIAKDCGYCHEGIRKLCIRHGIPLRNRHDISYYGKCRKYHFDEHMFAECNTPEKAYWLGFIMADGAIYKSIRDTWSLTIGIQGRDREHLERFKSYFNLPHPIASIQQILGNKIFPKCAIRLCSHYLIDDLGRYGIIERKSGQEKIDNIPKPFIRDFIRGYFDGDGGAGINHGNRYITFTSASARILEQISDYIGSAIDRASKIIKKHGNLTWRITYGGNIQVRHIADYLYGGSTVFLPRKMEILNVQV